MWEKAVHKTLKYLKRIQVIGVWNSSKQTLHDIIPVFRVRSLENSISVLLWCIFPLSYTFWMAYILTSQDFSWLQNGQVNWVSKLPVIFFLGGGFLFVFLRPMCGVDYEEKQAAEQCVLSTTNSTLVRWPTGGKCTAYTESSCIYKMNMQILKRTVDM